MAYRKDEEIEIVKRIETPRREGIEEEEVIEEEVVYINEVITQNREYQKEEEEKTTSNKILPMLFGITSIGIIGYLGLNYLKKDNTNITNTDSREPKEVTTYIEELAITKDSHKIEDDVIAVLSARNSQTQTEKQQEVSKPIIKNNSKEIAKQELVAQKEERAKQELVAQREEITKQELVAQREELAKKEVAIQKEELAKQKLIVQMKEIEQEEMVIPKEKIVHKKRIKKSRVRVKYETIKPRIYRVRKGDSLASIAKRFYGNPMDYKRIIRANSRIRSKKTSLRFGEKIIIPRKDNKKTRRFIIVEKGDTLASISKKIYGSRDKILKIVRANYRIKTKHSTLHIGQKVYIPK